MALTDVGYLFRVEGFIPAFQRKVQAIAWWHRYPWEGSQRTSREPYGYDSRQYVAFRHWNSLPFFEYWVRLTDDSTRLERMKKEMEEWGSSVTEKLNCTPIPPYCEENWTDRTPATYESLEQVKRQLARTIDGKSIPLNTFYSCCWCFQKTKLGPTSLNAENGSVPFKTQTSSMITTESTCQPTAIRAAGCWKPNSIKFSQILRRGSTFGSMENQVWIKSP